VSPGRPAGGGGPRPAADDLRAARPSQASRTYDFAGAVVEFSSTDRGWLAAAELRYAGFGSGRPPGVRVRYEVVAGLPDVPDVLDEPRLGPASGDRLDIAGPGYSVTADLAAGEVEISGPRHTYPVDAALRQILPLMLRDGVVLHTALVSDGRRTWACSGPSGAGKTTIAALLGERALCDELAVVRVSEDGIEGRSLPYWKARPGQGPLAGIHLLRHGAAHRRTRLAPGAAAQRLLAQVAWPTTSPAALARTLELVATITERVPVWELEFAPRADVAAAVFAEESA